MIQQYVQIRYYFYLCKIIKLSVSDQIRSSDSGIIERAGRQEGEGGGDRDQPLMHINEH